MYFPASNPTCLRGRTANRIRMKSHFSPSPMNKTSSSPRCGSTTTSPPNLPPLSAGRFPPCSPLRSCAVRSSPIQSGRSKSKRSVRNCGTKVPQEMCFPMPPRKWHRSPPLSAYSAAMTEGRRSASVRNSSSPEASERTASAGRRPEEARA
jgi:hypothetical protein